MGHTKRKAKNAPAPVRRPSGMQTLSAQAWAQVCQTIRQLAPQGAR